MIELIRQFYTVPRCFRIVSPNGGSVKSEYLTYDNTSIKGVEGITADGGTKYGRLPAFDISIAAEKSVSSKREEQNSIAKELYEMGVFAPENREAARTLLSMMDFEGRDGLLSRLSSDENTGGA